MTIDKGELLSAVRAIALIPDILMAPESLAEDVFLLSAAFPEPRDFETATVATCRALDDLRKRRVTAASLKYGFAGWSCFHYQHRMGQGLKADCRIICRINGDSVEVLAFGHRRVPDDSYRRIVLEQHHPDW